MLTIVECLLVISYYLKSCFIWQINLKSYLSLWLIIILAYHHPWPRTTDDWLFFNIVGDGLYRWSYTDKIYQLRLQWIPSGYKFKMLLSPQFLPWSRNFWYARSLRQNRNNSCFFFLIFRAFFVFGRCFPLCLRIRHRLLH